MVDVEAEDRRRTGTRSASARSLLPKARLCSKIRRPFTPPGDENNSTGPDAVELSPAQITAKVERDPVEWNARIEALRNVRARSARRRQEKRRQRAVGRRRESRQGVRSVSSELLVLRAKAPSSIRSSGAAWRNSASSRRAATPARSRRNGEGPQMRLGSRRVIAAAVAIMLATAIGRGPARLRHQAASRRRQRNR